MGLGLGFFLLAGVQIGVKSADLFRQSGLCSHEFGNLGLEVGEFDETLLQLGVLLLTTTKVDLQAFNLLGLLVEFLKHISSICVELVI